MTFIKILDKEVAEALASGGFSYTKESFNMGETLFAFEETPELNDAIRQLTEGKFSDFDVIRDSSLNV